MEGRYKRIRILPPRPGACRLCAANHAENEPHDLSSLYYQYRFRRRMRRFPTQEDAVAHCPAGNGAGANPEEDGHDGVD